MILLLVALAHAACPAITTELQHSQQALLEGALEEAQVHLSITEDSAKCQLFSHGELHHYLYLRGVYHYLREENREAERFFQRSTHAGEEDFGERMQFFYERFPKKDPQIPFRVRHSRFQKLYLNGAFIRTQPLVPAGPQLVQLVQDKTITYAAWIDIKPGDHPQLALPRKVSPRWLLAATGSGLLSAVSIWQALAQNKHMQDATSQAELATARQHQLLWSGSAIGFGVVTTTLIGIYLYW